MKFVHPKCLLRRMKQSITFECEVCKHKYYVHRVYAENTPTRLHLKEFVGGIAMKACHVLHFCLRICASFFYQLLMPLLVFWIWCLRFVRSLFEAIKLVHSHMFPTTFMMDWLYGIGYVSVVWMIMVYHGIIRQDEEDLVIIRGNEKVAENMAHIAVAPAPGNENYNIEEIGEDAREPQAIADLRNVWLIFLKDPLRWVLRLMYNFFEIIFVRLDVPIRRTCIQLVLGALCNSLIKHISKIFFGLAMVILLIAFVLKEKLAWIQKLNAYGGNFPPWAIACVVIVFTRIRKRTRDFLAKFGF